MKIAIIRIRGITGIKAGIKQTLDLLKIQRKNYCVVLEKTPSNIGMVKKANDFVTWGEVSEETLKELATKRGRIAPEPKPNIKKSTITISGKKYETLFRLSPPKGGFERKGIKAPFSQGGVLGYRGEKINDLIKKMM